jgi:hypothetical protein
MPLQMRDISVKLDKRFCDTLLCSFLNPMELHEAAAQCKAGSGRTEQASQ